MANKRDRKGNELDTIINEYNDEIRKHRGSDSATSKEENTGDAVSHLRGGARSSEERDREKEAEARRAQRKAREQEESEQLSFSKAATIIEDGLDDQSDRIYPTRQSRNVIEPPPTTEFEQEEEQETDQRRHIAVTAGEAVETAPEPEAEIRRPKVSKAALRKAHGTVVSRDIQKEKRTIKQKRTMVLGVFIAFFVVVGIIATVWSGVEISIDLATSAPLKEELAMEIFPLVIIDTPEFEDPLMLDNTAIVSASVWGFIVNEDDKSKYRKDDLGNIFVPSVDIEKHMRRLFGSEVTIKHQSVEDTSVLMTYDAENKQYVIESAPRFLPYTPRVDNVIKTGEIYTLRVSYILPTVIWNLEKNLAAQPSDKILEYRLLKNDNGYQVLSVKLIEIATASDYQRSQQSEGDVLFDDSELEDAISMEALSSQVDTESDEDDVTTSDTSSDTASE